MGEGHFMTSYGKRLHNTLYCRTVILAGLLAVIATSAGCSSAKTEPGSHSTSTTSVTPTAGRTPSPAVTSPAAVSAIKSAYTKFFNPTTSLNEAMTMLQEGTAFKATLKQ